MTPQERALLDKKVQVLQTRVWNLLPDKLIREMTELLLGSEKGKG